VVLFSQCARDVMTAFYSSPESEPRSDCREALDTRFVTSWA
jgi:hypothetical protein